MIVPAVSEPDLHLKPPDSQPVNVNVAEPVLVVKMVPDRPVSLQVIFEPASVSSRPALLLLPVNLFFTGALPSLLTISPFLAASAPDAVTALNANTATSAIMMILIRVIVWSCSFVVGAGRSGLRSASYRPSPCSV